MFHRLIDYIFIFKLYALYNFKDNIHNLRLKTIEMSKGKLKDLKTV